MRIGTGLVLGICLLAAGMPATAQDYPNRAITIVSNYPPAGGVDIVGRIVAAELQKRLGQSVVVENKPGATGMIGAAAVARSAPDGYTLLVTANPPITLMPFFTKASYDPRKDLVPIAKVGIAPTILVVPADSPYKNLKEFIEAARGPNQKIVSGVPGVGSSGEIELNLINKAMKTNIGTIPYRGANFIATDVMGGQIPAGVAAVPAMAGQIRAGKLRPLAVVSLSRSPIFPDVPTVQEEIGQPIDVFPTWYGFLAPAGTPKEVVARLESEMLAIMKDPAVIEKMQGVGNEVLLTGAAAFAKENEVEIQTFGRAVRETNVVIAK
jgi:tripartite-type tricarboxylate transporter receptor subunit TctC